jgi:hypothetical protein
MMLNSVSQPMSKELRTWPRRKLGVKLNFSADGMATDLALRSASEAVGRNGSWVTPNCAHFPTCMLHQIAGCKFDVTYTSISETAN